MSNADQKVLGFSVAGVHAGLKADNALDFALVVSDRLAQVAAVFTTNQVKAAPVLVDMDRVKANPNGIRAVAVNTRCANACTGEQGIADAHEMARVVAQEIGCAPSEVLVLSTGVIGTLLPMDKIASGARLAAASLGQDWEAAARAIMTTDTKPKLVHNDITLTDGRRVHMAGIAKGAGMIAPNMATMLAVIVMDVSMPQADLERITRSVNARTFNAIAVDGDTSTNDTVIVLANGASGVDLNDPEAIYWFEFWLLRTCQQLAHAIVRDGEGATKFIEIHVGGARSAADARKIADTIATSPLVKTAFYGADANWGRILAAAGRAGVPLDQTRLSLSIAPLNDASAVVQLIANGQPTGYSEAAAAAIMQGTDIRVDLSLGLSDDAEGSATVWTCDLSHDYVSINGHYRS